MYFKMLFEDSSELDNFPPTGQAQLGDSFFPTKGAELVYMKKYHDIKLSDIWIPSELLINRQFAVELNVGKPIAFHTLAKPIPSADCLSIYSEQETCTVESNVSSGENLLDSLEEVSCIGQNKCTIENENTENHFKGDDASYSQEIFKSPPVSIADLLEHLCISDSDSEDLNSNPIAESPNKYAVPSTMTIESDVDFSKSNPEDIFCPPFETDIFSPEILDLATEVLDNNGPNNEPSLNLILPDKSSQINSESAFDVFETQDLDVKLDSLNDVTDRTPDDLTDGTPDDLTDGTRQCGLSSWNPLRSEQSNNLDSIYESDVDTYNDFHLITSDSKMLNVDIGPYVETASSLEISELNVSNSNISAELLVSQENCFEVLKHKKNANFISNSSECKLESSKDVNKPQTSDLEYTENVNNEQFSDEVLNYSILYQRPKEEPSSDFKCANKQKSKKEKRAKKKNDKNIPLENFFLSKGEIADSDPNEFYESIMRRKFNEDSVPQTSSYLRNLKAMNFFPSLPDNSEFSFMPCENIEEFSQAKFDVKLEDNFLKESSRTVCHEFKNPAESMSNSEKIVIENIPRGVDEKMLRDLLANYGDIKRLNMRQNGKTLLAELIMDLEDPDWIIDSLNGNQPFGACCEGLKCYKQY